MDKTIQHSSHAAKESEPTNPLCQHALVFIFWKVKGGITVVLSFLGAITILQ